MGVKIMGVRTAGMPSPRSVTIADGEIRELTKNLVIRAEQTSLWQVTWLLGEKVRTY